MITSYQRILKRLLFRARKRRSRITPYIRHTSNVISLTKFRLLSNRLHFITFADGKIFTGRRLIAQVRESKLFSECKCYTAADLPDTFFSKRSQLFFPPSRGFGYWSWKPYIMLEEAKKLKSGDVLIYCDSGCTFVGYDKILSTQVLCWLLATKGSMPMVANNHTVFRNAHYTKGDALHYFNIPNNHSFLASRQWEAGRIGIVVCDLMIDFLKKWTDLCSDSSLVSDTPSRIANPVGFIEHRHDQSLFNLLLAETGVITGLESLFTATRLVD